MKSKNSNKKSVFKTIINFLFMAVSKGRESAEAQEFKRYIGIAPMFIKAVNPSKSEHEEIFNTSLEEAPNYLGVKEDSDGNEFQTARVSVVFNPDVEKIGFEMSPITTAFYLENRPRYNADKTKVQVIDKYGRTAWATKDEVASKSIPQYTNGPANISADYRPTCDGEEFLVDFLIQWLNIPGPAAYKDGKWVMKEDPSDSEVSLNLGDLFKGNVKEIAELIKLAANYAVKAAVGIRTTDEGKQYQQVFTRKFVKNGVTDYSKLDAVIAEFKSNGGAPNTDYECTPLHENVVEETKFKENTSEMPFDAPSSSPWD
jgi:hypothetical protein